MKLPPETLSTYRLLLCFLLLALSLLASQNIAAQNLLITVFKDGQPLSNATVCAGSKQQLALFGRFKTDSEGKLTLANLPAGKIIITANDSYAGIQLPIYQNVTQQQIYLRIPAEQNSVMCPDENTL